jgi:hypothetical protein
MSTKEEELKEASRLFYMRDSDAKPKYLELIEPATIIYNCVLLVIEHIPLLELVPGFYPESFCNGEYEGGLYEFKEECAQWCSNIEEEEIIPDLSLNKGDMRLTTSVRVTPEWIDSPLDSRWSYFRIPRSSVVVLTPEDSIKPYEGAIMKYESQIVWSRRN